jgi:hypothetical protein
VPSIFRLGPFKINTLRLILPPVLGLSGPRWPVLTVYSMGQSLRNDPGTLPKTSASFTMI